MRRSVLSAVLVAALSLVACSDQPTEPRPPEQAPVLSEAPLGCTPTPTAANLLTRVNELLPRSPLRTTLITLIGSLPSRYQDRIRAAVRATIFLIQDLTLRAFYSGRLNGGTSPSTFDKVLRLIEALHCYVGLTPPEFPSTTSGSDVVVGVVFPNSPTTTFAVPSEQAAVTIPTGAAPSATTIVITKLPDSPGPLRTSLDQYPFFYHFSGTTVNGPVTFNSDVIAGICLKEQPVGVPDANFRLAHNIFPFGFGDVEVLPRPTGAVPGIDCTDLPAGPGPIGSITRTVLNRFAWGAEKVFLPSKLHAASTALNTLGVGGTTKKFSEFGIVDIFSNPGSFEPVGPTESTEEGGTVTRTVLVTSDNGTPITGVPVTFTTEEGNGTVLTPQPVLTDEDGNASASWALPDGSGSFTLDVSVPAADNPPLETSDPPDGNVASIPDVAFDPQILTFTVAAGADDPIVLNLTAVEKLPGGTQHFTVGSGGAGPYVWSVNGVDGGDEAFGIITTNDDFSADYTAPPSVPTPATFDVCARRVASPANTACASVTITPVPSSGADVIVFNDVNVFDQTAAGNPNNIQLFKNLVNFTTTGTRNSVDGVLIHRGHGSLCGPDAFPDAGCVWTTFKATLTGEGSTVVDGDDITTPLTSIDADVKLIILVVPIESYSTDEVNSLKSFAGQGGRILFVGEHESFYGPGIGVENEFLTDMGAVMNNTGGLVDCGRNVLPSTSLRSHQITAGLSQLAMACASEVEPGPNDYALFYDLTNTRVLGAVAKIDLTPLAGLRVARPARIKRSSALRANEIRGIDVFSWGYSPSE